MKLMDKKNKGKKNETKTNPVVGTAAPETKPVAAQPKAPLSPAAELIASSGLHVASEKAINDLLNSREGAVAFAREVLARLQAKVTRVAERKAEKAAA
jgi:hypothetical protein